jgi:hypothetical protein
MMTRQDKDNSNDDGNGFDVCVCVREREAACSLAGIKSLLFTNPIYTLLYTSLVTVFQ